MPTQDTPPSLGQGEYPADGIVRLREGIVRIDRTTLIHKIDLALVPGKVTGLLGPNGAGKSTLLRVLARQQPLSSGELMLDELPYASFTSRRFSRRIAYLPQSIPASPGMTVDELACLGRFPWHGPLGKFTPRDRAAVDDALAITGMSGFAERITDSLSGGERQRCWIAMLLAQEAAVLLLDEPVSALDARHQIETMELIGQIARSKNVSILVTLHDVNLAARYCDRVVALKSGRTVWEGPAEAFMDAGILEGVYDTPMSVLDAPGTGGRFAVTMLKKRPAT